MVKFEGEELDGSTIKLKQYTGPIAVPFMRGEKVRLIVEAEVQTVQFNENVKTGKVFREHVLYVKDVYPEGQELPEEVDDELGND